MSKHTFTDPDLIELDKIWPLGQQLEVLNGGKVLVAGAYKGRYMHYIKEMFPSCELFGFEPQIQALEIAEKRLSGFDKVHWFNEALSTATRGVRMWDFGTDGASTVRIGGPFLPAKDVVEVFNRLDSVALFLLNAEGVEWLLIPHLLNNLMHHRIASMAIQFHDGYCSDQHKKRVLDQLDEYYEKTYEDTNNWTHWVRK